MWCSRCAIREPGLVVTTVLDPHSALPAAAATEIYTPPLPDALPIPPPPPPPPTPSSDNTPPPYDEQNIDHSVPDPSHHWEEKQAWFPDQQDGREFGFYNEGDFEYSAPTESLIGNIMEGDKAFKGGGRGGTTHKKNPSEANLDEKYRVC